MAKPVLRGFNRGIIPTIAVFNKAQTPLGFKLKDLVAAMQVYVDEHVAPVWGTPAKLVHTRDFVKGAWAMVFLEKAEERYSRVTTFLYRMSYQRVRVDPASLVIDPNLIPLYSRPVRIAMPSFTWVHDKRDNPVDTHKGSYNLLDTGLATSALGSESNFAKFLYQNSTYYTFHKKWVFARNTQIGLERPYGTNYYPGGSVTAIPLPELFFAGGGNSLRGFAINQAGPRDLQTGYPIGGQALFVKIGRAHV